MPEFVQSVLGFVLAIGILVTFHEFGHYWVARRCGVRVLCFSIGFGKPLWSRVAKDGTRWQVAAIPLGGYVKMLDEREAPVPEEQRHAAFNRKPVLQRIAIVAAGPLANFFLAIIFYALVQMIGQPALRPVLGPIPTPSAAAQAGVQEGDTLLQVAGQDVATWDRARLRLLEASLGAQSLPIVLQRGSDQQLSVSLALVNAPTEPLEFFDYLGLVPPQVRLEPILGQILADSPADRAGLRVGDRISSLDARAVDSWRELVMLIRERPGQTVRLVVDREDTQQQVSLQLAEVMTEQGPVGQLGAGVAEQAHLWQDFRFIHRLGPVQSVWAGVEQTLSMSVLTVKMLWRMVLGEVSVKNLSGPLSIAEFAGVSAAAGIVSFLGFLALISVSLGVLNLLPVPVLDGGHLLYYGIEAIKGSPLSERAQSLGHSVGLAMLLGLMTVALYNDLARLLS